MLVALFKKTCLTSNVLICPWPLYNNILDHSNVALHVSESQVTTKLFVLVRNLFQSNFHGLQLRFPMYSRTIVPDLKSLIFSYLWCRGQGCSSKFRVREVFFDGTSSLLIKALLQKELSPCTFECAFFSIFVIWKM